MLARPYLMTIHVIFSIHVNFPIKSRFVLKAIINRKKQWTVLCYLRKNFFSRICFLWYCTVVLYLINFSILLQSVHIFHVSLWVIPCQMDQIGTWLISNFDETFPGKRYIDRIILKISEQTDNLFKSYDTSKLAF